MARRLGVAIVVGLCCVSLPAGHASAAGTTVNCGSAGQVNKAIQAGYNPITITGNCDGVVRITRSGVILRGSSTSTRFTVTGQVIIDGATRVSISHVNILPASPAGVTLLLRNNANAAVSNFTIGPASGTVTPDGVSLQWNSSLQLSNGTVRGAGGVGVQSNSSLELVSSSVVDGSESGIDLSESSAAVLTSATVSGNAGGGIFADGSSHLALASSTVENNAEGGIVLAKGASATIFDSSISQAGTGKIALRVIGGASAALDGGNTLTSASDGIALAADTMAMVHQGIGGDASTTVDTITGPVVITNGGTVRILDADIAGDVSLTGESVLELHDVSGTGSSDVDGDVTLDHDSGIRFVQDAGENPVGISGALDCLDSESHYAGGLGSTFTTGGGVTSCIAY